MKKIFKKIMILIFLLFYDGQDEKLNQELYNAYYNLGGRKNVSK